MWQSRDRLLAGMFGIQLVAAIVFGLIVMSGLSANQTVPVAASTSGTAQGATGASTGTAGATAASTTDTGGTGTTTDSAGSDTSATSAGVSAEQTAPGDSSSSAAGAQPTDQQSSAAQPAGGPSSGAKAEGTRTGVTDDSVLVGSLVTQTGAINFRSSAQATKAYIDMVNEQGGVNGRKIKLMLRDDGLDENKGQQAVQEMIDKGVFSFVAFNAPLTEQSILPVLDKHHMPLIGAFAIKPHPLGYMFSAPYETYGKVGGDMLAKQGVKTPGLVYLSNQNEDTDNTIVESWKEGLKKHGITLKDQNIHAVDVTKASFDDVVISLRSNGVDGIGTILDATAMVRLQQSMNRAAYHPVHVSSPFGGDPAVLDNPNVGDSFEGTFVLSDVNFLGSNTPEEKLYEQQVRRRFGDKAELNWAGQLGWLGTKMFVEALKRTGADPTREKLLERHELVQGLPDRVHDPAHVHLGPDDPRPGQPLHEGRQGRQPQGAAGAGLDLPEADHQQDVTPDATTRTTVTRSKATTWA